VRAVADKLGATPAQIGLAWLLAHYSRTLVISGTADPAHLAENVAAGGIQLDADALGALEATAG
jgi:aryl-alcohol dehydrogenase-like predicted oxidoreductase